MTRSDPDSDSDSDEEEGVVIERKREEVLRVVEEFRIPDQVSDSGGFMLDRSVYPSCFKCHGGSDITVFKYCYIECMNRFRLPPSCYVWCRWI